MSKEFEQIELQKVNQNVLKVSFNTPDRAVSYTQQPQIINTIQTQYGILEETKQESGIQLT